MRISVHFTPLGVPDADIGGKPVVVVDILRATTTIVAALANGARAVVPAGATDEAIRIAQNLKDDVLLAGERKGERISGFALGNSPLEMTRETVAGKTLVMSTTNGTLAIQAAASGNPVFIGSATNFSAAVERARDAFAAAGEIVVLCAGRERGFALEDAYAAGRFAHALIPEGMRRRLQLNDAAVAALELVKRYGERWKRAISASAAARELGAKGFKEDVRAATASDCYDLVPVYANRQVTVR
jgi:2-phosphosulfolactate phosphatase